MDEFEVRRMGRVCGCHALNGLLGALFGAARHVYGGTRGVQHLDELQADSLVATGDNKDFACLCADIFLREARRWWPVLRSHRGQRHGCGRGRECEFKCVRLSPFVCLLVGC